MFWSESQRARLRWSEHVQRRDSEYIVRRMMRLQLPGWNPRGRPNMGVVIEDIKLAGVREEDAEDRVRRRLIISF